MAGKVVPRGLSDTEEALIKDLIVEEDRIHSIESAIREHAGCDEWKTQRTYRFTASKYHLISRRQRNHQSFPQSKALFIKVYNIWLNV